MCLIRRMDPVRCHRQYRQRRQEPMDSAPLHQPARSRRALGGALVSLAIPTILAACGAQTAGQPGLSLEAKPATLEWFGKLKGIAQSDIDTFVQQYKTARPNITLNV